MNARQMSRPATWLVVAAIAVNFWAAGCWWQKNEYSRRMDQTLKNWKIQQEIDAALGDRFDHIEDFTVSIRVPKGVQALEPPPDFLEIGRASCRKRVYVLV